MKVFRICLITIAISSFLFIGCSKYQTIIHQKLAYLEKRVQYPYSYEESLEFLEEIKEISKFESILTNEDCYRIGFVVGIISGKKRGLQEKEQGILI